MPYANALSALADPTRRAVFEKLRAGPVSVGDIAAHLPVSRPAVSQHLKVLKDAGLVQEERAGTRRIYSADGAALGELRTYIDDMWRATLGRFAAAAEREEHEP